MSKIRVGAIGVGGIGGSHLRLTRNCADVMEAVAVCDVNQDIAQRVAEEFGAEAHTDYRELCQRGDLDAVIVAVPHYLYAEVVCCALESGLHVFKEKPFAKTLTDAQQMVEAARQHDRRLVLAGQSKFMPAFMKGKEIVDSGVLGEVFLTRAVIIYRWGGAINDHWSWRGKEELSGGVAIIDAGWHILDMAHWYRGLPSAVYASVGSMKGVPRSQYDVDDKAAIILEYPDGGIGSIVSSYITLPDERRITLHGVNGTLDVVGNQASLILDGEPQEVSLPDPAEDPMTAQLRHFAEAIGSGAESTIAGPKRAYEVMQMVDAAYRSAESGAKVELHRSE